MKKITRNEVDFSEIFNFAKEHYGIEWNACNDLFFDTILDYKRYNDFEVDELTAELVDVEPPTTFTGDVRKAMEIILDFMKKNEVKSMRVMNG
jgi:hypothetical protein